VDVKKVLIITNDLEWGRELARELGRCEVRLMSQRGDPSVVFAKFRPDLTLITGPKEDGVTLSKEWRKMVRIYNDIQGVATGGQKILRSDCLPLGYLQFEADMLRTYL